MEPYFIEEVRNTVSKIKALQEDGCFCFQLITDSHVTPLIERFVTRQYHTFENMQAVNRQANVDAIFHLGDIPYINADEETQDVWTTENIEKWFQILKDNLHRANTNTYFVAGNHDSEYAREPKRDQWHRRMVAYQRNKITGYVPDEPYYCVDFAECKVRAVCMMSNYSDGETEYYGIYPDQMRWLAEDALQAPDGWSILLFSHICPIRSAQSDPQDKFEEFAEFMNAFHNRSVFRSDSFTTDFSNASTAKVIAMFVGHGHVDWIKKPGELPFYIVETGANQVHVPERETWPMPDDCTVAQRQYHTVTEDLWDTVIYNPQKGMIDLIRFGAGDDRHIDL